MQRIRDMARWLGSRLVFWAAVLLLLVFLTFFGLDMARGAPAGRALADAVQSSGHYLKQLAHGDLGTAYAADYGQRRTEVATVLREVLPRSLGLLGVSLLLSALLGVGLGAWAARRGRAPVLFLSILGISLPSFFLALLLQLLVLAGTRRLGRPLLPVGGFGWDAHLLLPALVLSARPIAQVTRITYISLSEVLAQDYIRTARSKGLPARVVWWVHAFRVAAPPVLVTLATSLRFALSTLPVVEQYFGWPGLGYTLLRAIARRDDDLSVALALGLGLTFLTLQLLSEWLVRLLDPRTRESAPVEGRGERRSWRERWAAVRLALRDLIGLGKREALPPLSVAAAPQEAAEPAAFAAYRRRTFLRAVFTNGAFLSGALLVLLLVGLYFFGPSLARYNPYATKGLVVENGQFSTPPYPPSSRYWLGTDVLGRDLYSLLVAGAQQTLTLALFATGARLLLGTLLGLLAGLTLERTLDRALSALAQIFSALPALVVAMILILGLGVRKGMWVFVVGLAAVGWSEIFQFVRAETARLLRRPFVESAVAVGNSGTGVATRHLLPNLLPALISLASLEMAGVLLLVGELGFLGVFLGGGAFAEVFIGSPPYHYSDIPEWASLLSNVRLYARSYPWTALSPALTFFLAVLAFNLFGEGLRRLLPRVGFGITRLFNRWTLSGAVAVALLAVWVGRSAGPMGTYRRLAAEFDADHAAQVSAQLAAFPRGIGMEGQAQAAQWLAQQLEALGLQPAGERGTYFLTVKRDYFEVTTPPVLEAPGADLTFTYRQDFAETPSYLLNAGEGQGELVVLGLGELTVQRQRFGGLPYAPALADLPVADKVVLLLHPVPPHLLPYLPRQATLVVADDPAQVTRRATLSAYGPTHLDEPMSGAPWLTITPEAADRLLARAGLSLAELQKQEKALPPDEIRLWDTGLTVHAAIQGEIHRKVPVQHVLAYWPGSDDELDDRLVVLMAPYDGLRPDPLGVQVPGAVNHASAVGTVLEALRTLRAGAYQPRRTLYVAFYASQGFDYGKVPNPYPNLEQYLFAKAGFGLLKPEVVFWLESVGGGDGKRMVIGGNGNLHMTQLTEQAARLAGARSLRDLAPLDISIVFDENARGFASDYPLVTLSWEGASQLAGQPTDTPQALRTRALRAVGRTLTLLLALVGYAPTW